MPAVISSYILFPTKKILLFLFNPVIFFDSLMTSFKNPRLWTRRTWSVALFRYTRFPIERPWCSLPAVVSSNITCFSYKTLRPYKVTCMPQVAASLIVGTVTGCRNLLRRMTDGLSVYVTRRGRCYSRCLRGAVNREATSTYTYVLPPIGNLHTTYFTLISRTVTTNTFTCNT
jgi:hypothetical protein